MPNIYVGSVEWTAVAAWTALTSYVSTSNGGRGDYVRQLAGVAVGSERVFRCTTSGTSLAAEPTWVLTKNATTTETLGPVWTECTGQEADQVSGTWKAPHARLANAFAATWGAAGDSFYISEDHAETQAAAMTLTSPGTAAAPCNILCVNHAGTVPPVSADLRTTATVTTTGNFSITFGGYAYCYGVIFNNGSGAVTAGVLWANANLAWYFKLCSLRKLGTTANTNAILAGVGSATVRQRIIFDNTTVQFGATGDSLVPHAFFLWVNTPSAVIGATLPTTLFSLGGAPGGSPQITVRDVDLSALGAGATLVGASAPAVFTFMDCTFGASVAVAAAASDQGGPVVYVIRSDSAGTNYRHEKYSYMGTQVVETTIVRTGGASDGTTPLSWKIVTTANSKWILPFECVPISFWNETVGSPITVTLQGIWGGGAVPISTNIWMDVEYPSSTQTPIGSLVTTTVADALATGASLPAGSGTWGGSTTKFQLSATITPQMKGPITLYVKAALATSTFYIDPKVT